MLRITTPDLRSMSQPAAIDPDISATLSDFLTYTEHLPSSVIRSLTLIQTLNEKSYALQINIDQLLRIYGKLPEDTSTDAPDPTQLRFEISKAYNKLEECKRMSAAESVRIEDMVAKEAKRLTLVSKKLKALPMPPSRDPTPEPVVVSPRLKRNNQAQQQADKRAAAQRTSTAPRVRGRKIMVPGEVLPPPNPDSPPPSEPSDWGSPPPASPDEQRRRHKSIGRQRTPKPTRPPKEKALKTPRIRPPGVKGTNAHSAVAGISTSNALSALQAPPPDARSGSKWKPWKRLTEYELATIRKRMKKNAKWIPSFAMKNRELKDLGRGQAAMDQAREDAEAQGVPFLDEYDTATWTDPTQGTISVEEQAEANAILGPELEEADEDQTMINRGMRLNEAKRIKREKLKAEEQALAQQLQQIPAIPEPSTVAGAASVQTHTTSEPRVSAAATATDGDRKRKREATPVAPTVTIEPAVDSPDVLSRPAAPPKKIKLNLSAPTPPISNPKSASASRTPKAAQPSQPAATKPVPGDRSSSTLQSSPGPSRYPVAIPSNKPSSGTLVPLAPAAPSTAAPPKSTTPAPPSRPRSRRASIAPDAAPLPPPTRSTRNGPTITLKGPKAASAEPPHRRNSLRRGSNASLPGGASKLDSPAPKQEPASRAGRRVRRPVPGLVTTEEGEGAKVSVGRRKAAPNKKKTPAKGATAAAKKDDALVAEEEPIDPDEPRYCVCGDVSWGTMIACDSDDVSICLGAFVS